jgi:hypothetical protein
MKVNTKSYKFNLDPVLFAKAANKAWDNKLSFGEYLRKLIKKDLNLE